MAARIWTASATVINIVLLLRMTYSERICPVELGKILACFPMKRNEGQAGNNRERKE
jgi:hypothetical protein